MRRVTGHTAFGLDRRMFISKWTLLVRVTLHARGISTSCQSGLFEFKPTVRVMAITTAHGTFHNFVMEWRGKCRLNFAVTTQAKLRVIRLQHLDSGKAWLLSISCGQKYVGTRHVLRERSGRVWRMTLGAAYVVAPVFPATEVIVLFLARMAGQTSLRRGLGRFVLEGNDLRWIAFFDVRLAGTVARFATRSLSLPAFIS